MLTKTIKIPASLFRAAKVELAGEGDAKEFRMSISSDTPYMRYDWKNDENYYEVLDHSPGGMDEERLKSGLPVLFNHDRNQHLGRAAGYENDGHKCTLTGIRFSEDPFAQSKKKDAESGVLPDTSVGYEITDEGECIGAQDGIPIYKFKWRPFEGSLVTVPADITVGAGRSRAEASGEQFHEISVKTLDKSGENPHTNTKETILMPEAPAPTPEVDVVKERQAAVKDFQARCAKIDGWVGGLKNEAWKSKALEFAAKHKSGDANFDEFRNEALTSFEGVEPTSISPEIGMSKKEVKQYSIAEAIFLRGQGKALTGLYKEASDAVAKLTRREADGFFIPDDVTSRSLQEIHGLGKSRMDTESQRVVSMVRALTASNFTGGGALVGHELLSGSLIELLLNKIAFAKMGITYLGGLVGNVAIPKVTGPTANSYWLPEGGTVSGTDMTFAQLGLTPHRLVATMAYDKQLVAQASLSVEALVRDYIARVMAIEKDRAMLNGTGSAGQPLGLLNMAGVQVAAVTAGTPTWAQVVNFETLIGKANAELGPMAWLTTPGGRGLFKTTPKISGTNATYPIYLMEDNEINGYPVEVSNNVPNDYAIFGVPSEFIAADWAGIDMVVNPYSLDQSGQIRVTVTQWTDNGLRHEVAFVVSANKITT